MYLKSKDEELKKIHQNHGNDITQGVRYRLVYVFTVHKLRVNYLILNYTRFN